MIDALKNRVKIDEKSRDSTSSRDFRSWENNFLFQKLQIRKVQILSFQIKIMTSQLLFLLFWFKIFSKHRVSHKTIKIMMTSFISHKKIMMTSQLYYHNKKGDFDDVTSLVIIQTDDDVMIVFLQPTSCWIRRSYETGEAERICWLRRVFGVDAKKPQRSFWRRDWRSNTSLRKAKRQEKATKRKKEEK